MAVGELLNSRARRHCAATRGCRRCAIGLTGRQAMNGCSLAAHALHRSQDCRQSSHQPDTMRSFLQPDLIHMHARPPLAPRNLEGCKDDRGVGDVLG